VSLADGVLLDNSGIQSLYHAGSDIIVCNEMSQPLDDLKKNRVPKVSPFFRPPFGLLSSSPFWSCLKKN
jgi:hypothetical protein